MLRLEQVDLRYGAALALRNVSIGAAVGQVTCLLGRNGVGKSSLLRTIVGHHPIFKGAITWNGEDISRLKPYERARRGIGYAPQGREIFPLLTVRRIWKPASRCCRAALASCRRRSSSCFRS